MNLEEINKLLNQIIDNSKFKDLDSEQKETLKKKIIQTIIFNNNNYYNITAIIPEITDEFSQEYTSLINSFKLK